MLRFALRVGWLLLISCGGGKTSPATTPAGPSSKPEVAAGKEPVPPPAGDRSALTSFDEANPRSLDRAMKAADALGAARDASAIDDLAAVALRPIGKPVIAVQIAAVRALGRMTAARPRAAQALAKVIARDAPPRGDATYTLYLALVGSAVNASAEIAEPSLAGVLVPAIYRTPELSSQVRRALAAIGAPAAAEMRKALAGESPAVEAALASRGETRPTSLRQFYGAVVLGDLREQSARTELFAMLGRSATPAYYVEDEPAPTTQHTAAFDALRKLGSAEAAPQLEAIWKQPRTPVADRAGAIQAYAFSTRDTSAVPELAAIALDNAADDTLRIEAAAAVGRLGRDTKHITAFLQLAKKYLDASAKKRAAADKLEPKKKQADALLDDAKDALDKAKTKVKSIVDDPQSTAEQIRAATETAKLADASYKQARQKHRSDTLEWKTTDAAAKAYVGYARMFQTHVARIALGIHCKDDVACYAGALAAQPGDVARDIKKHVPDVESWNDEDKLGLAEAYADRAMIELGKRGVLADDQLAKVLAALAIEDRPVRESILNALPAIAPVKCPTCITALDAAINSGRSKTYLEAAQIETQIVRNYMASR
jgi:hypothetical protein